MPKPNTRDAMKRFRAGKAGFTDKAHLKAKGLIPRADGTKKKSPQYEDAPANATGTAVAGTGDDSSTVVVRTKKDKEKMKDRLLRRFKIRETIDRLVPAIEPPTDEVRERVNQLKELAKKEEGFASDAQRRAAFASGYKAKGKKKNKKEMAAAAAGASTGMKKKEEVEEDMDRQPQDKDVKKVKGTQPKKYYKTLDKDTKKKRADFFKTRKPYSKSDDDDDYKAAPGDAGAKTKKSIHTKKFKQMYGEVRDLNEKIKGLENKAKKTGMPYSILKQVYNRGMAAWKGGHRPGATQQQWALARVNSFVTKSSGTWGGADKDLAKKVRAAKK